ncbi:aldo/keto reductase [Alicyclobacillus sp. TC]|uniref:Diketogulonate reductase-like aldo/keto reductase n=1 Tax=Alicyclobacillus tolerans TaxID=90970 RepID=A0ABT9LTX2_9BACL|nr:MULTISPECIES: aldo/keto reductase [Alicyclobacillus]MDP9727710.1 diketogulonate reductase-like aldo/keto reductase [Alicyclobacillus tengchongensis]QRF24396.1 aldo/keto reductase [Alicyclobacillus sp. TC]
MTSINSLTSTAKLNNGVEMPYVGLGVWQSKQGGEVENAVRAALELGYRHIDTAAAYGNEEGVGQAIRDSGVAREEIFITTKLWNNSHGYEKALQAFEVSRKKLGVDYVDLYLIHWAIEGKYLESWRAFEKLLKDGYVRAIGVSNFEPKHLQDIMNHFEVVPAVNQVEFHPYLTQRELYEFCRAHHIQLEAWSPLMRGGELLNHPLILRLAEKYSKTPAQIVLRWDLQQEVVTIPKSVRRERIAENAQLFDFQLSQEEVAEITALNRNQRSFEYDPNHVDWGLE